MKAEVYIETTIPSYLAARPRRIGGNYAGPVSICTHPGWSFRKYGPETPFWPAVGASGRYPRVGSHRRDTEISRGSDRKRADSAQSGGRCRSHSTVYGCEYLLTWNCRHIANAELYRAIGRVGSIDLVQCYVRRPGLKGFFDIGLDFTANHATPKEARKAPAEVLVVDHAEKVPAEN
jgi:hypothetical protein